MVIFPPCRRRMKLDALKRGEEDRAEEFSGMLNAYAQEGVRGVEAQGPIIRQRLVKLVRPLGLAVPPSTCTSAVRVVHRAPIHPLV